MKFLLPLLLLGSLVSYCHSQSVLTIINTRQYELVSSDGLNNEKQYGLVLMDGLNRTGYEMAKELSNTDRYEFVLVDELNNTKHYELVLVDILNGTSQYELVSMDRNIKLGFDFIFLIVCSVLMIFFILTKNNISLLMVLPVYSATILYMVL